MTTTRTRQPRPLDDARFALLDRLWQRLHDAGPMTDEATRRAVAELTTSAAPHRADRLRPRPDEPAVLVERLAVWALHRADDEAVARAGHVLDEDGQPCAVAAAAASTCATSRRVSAGSMTSSTSA